MTSTSYAARDDASPHDWRCGGMARGLCGRTRGRWSPLNIALMVLGLIVFWPLGFAMLAYILWGERLRAEFDDMRAKGGPAAAFGMTPRGSGNAAFDDYRAETLRRLEEERRRLEEEQEAFAAFVRDLRRAKDKEEFDRFMAQRTSRSRPDAEPPITT